MIDSNFDKAKDKIRLELADHLGIEPEDILDDSLLTEDLHMKASDLTDFVEILGNSGFDTGKIDLTEIETFLDLVEALTDHE